MTVNLVYIYGPDPHPVKTKILKGLPSNWNIYVLKFMKEKIDLPEYIHQIYIFDDPIFSTPPTTLQITEAEKWLSHSFHLALNYGVHWDKSLNHNHNALKGYYELMTKLVLYFRKFFTQNKINLFSMYVASGLPFVLAALTAKKLGIHPIIIGEGGIDKSIFLYDFDFNPIFWKKISHEDIQQSKEFFSKRYQQKEKKHEGETVGCDNRKRFGLVNSMYTDIYRLYNKLFNTRKDRNLPYPAIPTTIRNRVSLQARKLLVPLSLEKQDLGKKFLFFPMHYDMETHLTWREHFTNQWELMRKVARTLPLDTYLFTKPHPNWLCTEVPLSEIPKLKKYRNIKILPPSTNPLELVKKSMGVVTINSTTGLEAICFGKPLITFGHSFYAKEGVALCVYDMKKLQEAVDIALNKPNVAYDQHKRDFLMAEYYKHLVSLEQTPGISGRFTEADGKKLGAEIALYTQHLQLQSNKN